MASYRQLISHIDLAWANIHLKHEHAIAGLLSHLRRNNGRLLETTVTSIGGDILKAQKFEQHSILTSISHPEAIPLLKQTAQRATLVEAFIYAVRSVKTEPNEQLFSNLGDMYKKTLDAAQSVDACLAFTVDFFHPIKLEILSDWLEKQRRIRLADKPDISKLNLGPKLRKIMGTGVEFPTVSLCDSLRMTGIPAKLAQRGAPGLDGFEDRNVG